MPRKRKISPDPSPLQQPSSSYAAAAVATAAEPRRATRQTPIPPPPVPRVSSRVHSSPTGIESALNGVTDEAAGHQPEPVASQQQQKPVKRGRGRPPKNPVQPSTASTTQPTIEDESRRTEGQLWPQSTSTVPLPDMGHLAASKENIRPLDHMAIDPAPHAPRGASTNPTSDSTRPQLSTKSPLPRGGGGAQSPIAASAVPAASSTPQTGQNAKPTTTPAHKQPRPDRNIEKVVFGDLCFRTWYPSYYGKEVLGDTSGNAAKGSKDGATHDAHLAAAMKGQTKHKQEHTAMLDRLYICPSCFKYSKEIVAWWGHVRVCEQRGRIPGRKIYVHPRGKRTILVPVDRGATQKKRKGDAGVRHTEEVVQDEGEWSIWEVDGEKDGLFCQNLSLFAKLWLDNKSVFFDVTGFKYFLLVYTPPPPKTELNLDAEQQPPQVVGFFSKEKMSWDNNNLACILIFPPWQRKSLGALLMGASYEISRREGIMGGPEKPISELGRKGYRRFWAGEIARWLLSLERSTDEREVIIDVNDCSQATWIAPEDCLATLREMDVYEDAGLGPGKPPPAPEDEVMGDGAEDEGKAAVQDEVSGAAVGEDDGDDVEEVELVNRVRIDKETIRRYVKTYGISLERSCDADGFVEGYAVKVEEEDEEMG